MSTPLIGNPFAGMFGGSSKKPQSQNPTPNQFKNPQGSDGYAELPHFGSNQIIKNEDLFHDPNAVHHLSKQLEGTLKDPGNRYKVAKLIHESRGGSGVTKEEIKTGLNKLGLTEDQKWAVRKKLGIW